GQYRGSGPADDVLGDVVFVEASLADGPDGVAADEDHGSGGESAVAVATGPCHGAIGSHGCGHDQAPGGALVVPVSLAAGAVEGVGAGGKVDKSALVEGGIRHFMSYGRAEHAGGIEAQHLGVALVPDRDLPAAAPCESLRVLY